MSDRYDMKDEPPHQDWSGGRDPRYASFDKALEALKDVASSGCSPERQRAFEIIRDTLEEAGIPFIRANTLAERCYRALGEIL